MQNPSVGSNQQTDFRPHVNELSNKRSLLEMAGGAVLGNTQNPGRFLLQAGPNFVSCTIQMEISLSMLLRGVESFCGCFTVLQFVTGNDMKEHVMSGTSFSLDSVYFFFRDRI